MNSGTGLNILQRDAAGALLRRRHRRAAGGPVRRGPGPAGVQAGRGDLLDLPAARLRPDRPRRLPAEPERGVRHGPRRAGRRRRAHPPRRVRHRLPALPAQHRADGSARRGDARPHAPHRAALRRRPGRPALPARRGGRRAAAAQAPQAIEIGTGEILREGDAGGAPVGYGTGVGKALEAADILDAHGISVTVADARFAKPIDAGLAAQLAAEHELLVTVEEGVLAGGFGSAVWETLSDAGLAPRILRVGLPDRYVTHGAPALLHEEVGFTGERIAERIEAAVVPAARRVSPARALSDGPPGEPRRRRSICPSASAGIPALCLHGVRRVRLDSACRLRAAAIDTSVERGVRVGPGGGVGDGRRGAAAARAAAGRRSRASSSPTTSSSRSRAAPAVRLPRRDQAGQRAGRARARRSAAAGRSTSAPRPAASPTACSSAGPRTSSRSTSPTASSTGGCAPMSAVTVIERVNARALPPSRCPTART